MPSNVFAQCFAGVINKQLPNLNPSIFRTLKTFEAAGLRDRPEGFEQRVPDLEYRNKKRASVFQKVDLDSVDFSQIPIYEKSAAQLEELLPIL